MFGLSNLKLRKFMNKVFFAVNMGDVGIFTLKKAHGLISGCGDCTVQG